MPPRRASAGEVRRTRGHAPVLFTALRGYGCAFVTGIGRGELLLCGDGIGRGRCARIGAAFGR
jgi:hypothetical protein